MQNDVEIEKIWAQKTDGVTWAQNSGYWKGLALIKKNYGQHVDPLSVKGQISTHPQSTPVIEIAGDRKTAKGIWYTVGVVGGAQGSVDEMGKPQVSGQWMFERYGVDFVNEDGRWKIWHMHIYTDYGGPFGVNAKSGGAPQKAEKIGRESVAMSGGKPVVAEPARDPFNPQKTTYEEMTPNTVPRLIPRPPEPYRTFSETFSYTDENEWENATT